MNSHKASKPDGFLRKSNDFERVKRRGQRYQTPLFNLVSHESALPLPRVGIVVGRRLGKAVLRNRAKRIFRELVRHTRTQLVNGRDIIVFPKRKALSTKHQTLKEMWKSALHHEGLLLSLVFSSCSPSASG